MRLFCADYAPLDLPHANFPFGGFMSIDLGWQARVSQRLRTDGFEILLEIGCHDEGSARELMAAIDQVVRARAGVLFPVAAGAAPCLGCGEGRM